VSKKLFEGARAGDLDFLISSKIHFDEYDSKMGKPDSVVTASFKIKQREPALDLVSFLENGYDWILDADVSTGEVDDGEYLVFLEVQRRADLVDRIIEMLDDMQHLTNIKPNRWKFKWYRQSDYQDLTPEALRETIPSSPKKYNEYVESFKTVREKSKDLLPAIDELKRLSGIK
jgi:hypothetical protein